MHSASRASILQGLLATTVNPLRTALSTLGIVIGVASVITTLSLTDGLENYARDQIASQTDVQSIAVNSRTYVTRDGFSFPIGGYPIFTLSHALDLQRQLSTRAEVSMVTSGQAIVASPPALPHVATVTATLANYPSFGRKDVFAGRFFTDFETARNAPVVEIGRASCRERV